MHLLDLSGALLPASFSSALLTVVGLVVCLYLWHVNRGLGGSPQVVDCVAVKPWTEKELREAYDKLREHPIDVTPHLPPKQQRRYIVTGGTGLVGGAIVQQLLLRGQDPSLVRILDIRPPSPKVAGSVRRARDLSRADFVQVDVGSKKSVDEAFARPWPSHAANWPLTVFHTAAVIRVSERAASLLALSSRVNELGTAYVLDAARTAGADIFVATSSGSIAIRPLQPWLSPFQRWPIGYYQRLTDADYDLHRPHGGYYGNYPESKARAEALVRAADDPKARFRTGCIRPASGVYGSRFDNTVGAYLRTGGGPDWLGHIVNNFVHTGNVALAHLLYEQVLISPAMKEKKEGDEEEAEAETDADQETTHESSSVDNNTNDDDNTRHDLGGQAFTIIDPTPPIRFSDLQRLHLALAHSPMRFYRVPPVLPFLLSHLIELYSLIHHLIILPLTTALATPSQPLVFRALAVGIRILLPPLTGLPVLLQPALFGISSVHLDYSDEPARRPQQEGGLGYHGVWGTMDGMVGQVVEWNDEWDEARRGQERQVVGGEVVDKGAKSRKGKPEQENGRVKAGGGGGVPIVVKG
ncbi:putative 3-beta hydroxysteroid dehydrogenase/isomerase family protein [Phyllosticta capitalensis]